MIIAVVGYTAATIWLIRQETRLVFQAGSTLATGRPPFPYEQVDVPRSDGIRQFAWLIRHSGSDSGPWVLYLHGNISTIASHVNISHYRILRELGMNVLAPEFQGFGGIPGVPTQSTLQADARAASDYLLEHRKIPVGSVVTYGWSLGSVLAVHLASRVPPAGMILEGAPASLVDLTTRKYPLFPLRLLMRSSAFDSIRRIDRLTVPMLFLHASEDEVVPIADGRRLFEAATAPKTFVEVNGGHISAIEVDAARFAAAIREFVVRHVR